ncbi:glucose-6-phosphate dehydrogenase [Ligilactobacillus cholophilus]|uniref:glucose-6-phosphate dehydrogenase n=1 Tax=Ligilactobacillus cholophilus TaxID=3050131 RepID=UPI0025AF5856|nr:glucose-6-phosphate dehydrogenase [Ligilactobacillus cholophilus]
MKDRKTLFIIFGATGDLAQRKLYPALFNLYQKGFLKDKFAVIGTARRPWTNEHLQEVVRNSVADMEYSALEINQFASHFYYQSHNVTDTQHYETLNKLADQLDKKYDIGGNRIFYLATSPAFFGTIAKHLRTQKLVTENGYNRLVIEKPFGHNLKTAKDLNDSISKYFDEKDIFQIDHYLGKEMVQSIYAIRFANPIFSSLWNNRYISNIQITVGEVLGVEERAGYYENVGALRDMVQNHILQLVSLLTMNAPVAYNADDIEREKISALKSLKIYEPDEVSRNFIRGQYGPAYGMPAYREESQVSKDSMTETFVAGKIQVNNMNFADVPIYIRTGKRMAVKGTRIDVVFKDMPNNIFSNEKLNPNVLTINIDPNPGTSLRLNEKEVSETSYPVSSVTMNFRYSSALKAKTPEAYEKLLFDVIKGDATNFVHWKEVEYSWKFIDAIREAWDQNGQDPAIFPNYECGSMGPREADELLIRDGNYWEFNPLR